jgi:hypothetical protein
MNLLNCRDLPIVAELLGTEFDRVVIAFTDGTGEASLRVLPHYQKYINFGNGKYELERNNMKAVEYPLKAPKFIQRLIPLFVFEVPDINVEPVKIKANINKIVVNI